MDPVSETPRERAPQPPGAMLAAERERQGLSRADLAQRLHMSVSQVEALEVGDYARLPRGTFLRGFTRNYARAVGLDPEALVGLLAEDAPRETAPGIVVPSQNIRFDPLGQRLANPYVKAAGIAAALLVLGFAAMYWWLFIRPQATTTVTVKKPAAEASRAAKAPPAEAPGHAPGPAGAEPAPAQAPHAGTQPPVPAAPAEAVPAQPAATGAVSAPPTGIAPAPAPAAPAAPAPAEPPRAAAPGEGQIRLSFRAAAWVEVTDARGKVLLSRTHPGGSAAEVAGKPPFSLVIGNAPEVRLTYNGREVDLAPHTRVAVARFTLQ
jgi:cytoskeleton protein RodZ